MMTHTPEISAGLKREENKFRASLSYIINLPPKGRGDKKRRVVR